MAKVKDTLASPGFSLRRVTGKTSMSDDDGVVLMAPIDSGPDQVWVVTEPGMPVGLGMVARPGRGAVILRDRGVMLHSSRVAMPIRCVSLPMPLPSSVTRLPAFLVPAMWVVETGPLRCVELYVEPALELSMTKLRLVMTRLPGRCCLCRSGALSAEILLRSPPMSRKQMMTRMLPAADVDRDPTMMVETAVVEAAEEEAEGMEVAEVGPQLVLPELPQPLTSECWKSTMTPKASASRTGGTCAMKARSIPMTTFLSMDPCHVLTCFGTWSDSGKP